MDKNLSLVFLSLKWNTVQKKIGLAISNDEEGKRDYNLALKEIESIKSKSDTWENFFINSIEILKKYNIRWIDN